MTCNAVLSATAMCIGVRVILHCSFLDTRPVALTNDAVLLSVSRFILSRKAMGLIYCCFEHWASSLHQFCMRKYWL